MGPKKAPVNQAVTDNVCRFCSLDLDNEFYLGKKYTSEGITAHYYCLLFACGLQQNGTDDDGIFGFLDQDIRKELNRAAKLRCSFCKQKGAATGCLLKKCRATYHLPCGLINHSLCQFFGTFPSFCKKHRPRFPELSEMSMKLHDERCNICLENLLQSENLFIKLEISERSKQTQIETLSSEETYFRLLYTPCCKKWLHLTCIQQQAYNAGLYFIKCPLCNDKDLFKKAIIDNGIYIPDKDASWEESAAFHDLERRYDNCDASHCSCPKGRGHCEDVGTWELYVCALCGSNGMHLGCLPPEMQHDDAPDWVCDFCVRIERQIEQTRKSKIDPVSTLKTIRSTEPIATASNKMVIGDLKDPILVNGDVEQTTSESSVKIELPALSINSLKKEDSTMDQISVEMQLTDISNTEHVENGENGLNRRRSRSPAISRLQDENLPFRKRRLKFYESFNLHCQLNQQENTQSTPSSSLDLPNETVVKPESEDDSPRPDNA